MEMGGQRMSDPAAFETLLPGAAHLAAWLPLGFLAGVAHFALLRLGAGLIVEARVGRAMLLMAGRFALTGAVLALAAADGALPLIAASFGLMIGRAAVLRREDRRTQ